MREDPAPAVLCLNGGSSSVKFAVYASRGLEGEPPPVISGDVPVAGRSLDEIFSSILREMRPHRVQVAAVGHRVVFGGDTHAAPTAIDDALLADLERFVPLAPLHLPPEIALIRHVFARLPGTLQVACFDTQFHARIPPIAKALPLPRSLREEGVRRYGFHGLSYEYVAGKLGQDAAGRTIVAHLGSGCSLAALRDGAPLDTTMGFTPLGGLMMGTRPGDLDPGILLYLQRSGRGGERLERMLDRESGLLGVSATTADMRTLLATRAADPRAAEAVELFVYTIRKHVGALAMILGGLDLLVFTGGIGENAKEIRDEVVAGILPLRPSVRTISTNENLVVARQTAAVAATISNR